jgi:hypothetical protein
MTFTSESAAKWALGHGAIHNHWPKGYHRVIFTPTELAAALNAAAAQAIAEPIDMVLHCPSCHVQHIDAPEFEPSDHEMLVKWPPTWTNPPHRSHLCGACGRVWRPADVPTNGVAAVKTKGKSDKIAEQALAQRGEPVAWLRTKNITGEVSGVFLTRDVELRSESLEPLYAAAPDHTALLRQACEALEVINFKPECGSFASTAVAAKIRKALGETA